MLYIKNEINKFNLKRKNTMYETIYIEKNKSNRFGVHFYEDATQWNVFKDIYGMNDQKLAVICSECIKNDAWEAFADSFDNEDVLCLSEKNADSINDFITKKRAEDYTFVVLSDTSVMKALYENITSDVSKGSFICVPVTPEALFQDISIRPLIDKNGETIRKEWYPKAVYVDVSVLAKASPLEFRNAIASAFKLAISHKASMFEWMISNMYELTDCEEEAICELLERGFNVMKERIEKDTAKERAISVYAKDFYDLIKMADSELSFADCMSLALVCQTYLSWKKDLISMEEYYEIRDMFVFFGLSITETFATADELTDILMNSDADIIKKENCVYIRKLGKTVVDASPSKELIKEALEQIYFNEEAID